MIESLLQDAALRSHLIVQHKLEVSPVNVVASASSSQPQAAMAANLLIDFDSLVPTDCTVASMLRVERVLAGLVTRQGHVTASLYWSGGQRDAVRRTIDSTNNKPVYVHPFVGQAVLGLLRAYLPKFRKDFITFIPTLEPAHLVAIHDATEVPHHNKHNTLVCTTNSEALYSGTQVCRNIDRFLVDGGDVDVFAPQRLISMFPAFSTTANFRLIPAIEFLLQSGFIMGTPRSDEPLALYTYRQCEHRLQSDPIAAVLWMLQRVAYASVIPLITQVTAERLFPGFASLDPSTQEKWLDLANRDSLASYRNRKMMPAGGVDDIGLLGHGLHLGLIGPWCLPVSPIALISARATLTGNDGSAAVVQPFRWWSQRMGSQHIFEALEPVRHAIHAMVGSNHVTQPSMPSGDSGTTPVALLPLPSALWPRLQRNIDSFSLWRVLSIRASSRNPGELAPRLFSMSASLASDLAAPGVLHPAIYLTFALVAGSMQLYEWEWVALLTCCCATTSTALNPLFRCATEGVKLAVSSFLSVYEHVVHVNEVCNGAFFPVAHLSKLPTDFVVGSPIPPMATFDHLTSVFADDTVGRQEAHERYAAVVRDHGTCCAFANPSTTPHLSIYHRVLVTAVA